MSQRGIIKRHMLIWDKLRRRHFPSLQEMLNHLDDKGIEIEKRTLERDFETFRDEFGIQVSYDRFKKGYFIDEETSVVNESFYGFLEMANTADLLSSSIKKNKELLPYLQFDSLNNQAEMEFFKELLNAVTKNKIISFKHFNYYTEKISTITLEPYLLKEFQKRWYVIGIPKGKNKMLTYGLDRISDLKISDEVFDYDSTLKPQEKFNSVVGVTLPKKPVDKIRLTFTRFQGNYIKSLPWHHSQKVLVDNEKELQIELKVRPTYELIQKILANFENLLNIEPASFKEEIKAMVNTTMKRL